MTVNRIAAGAALCCAVLFVGACGGDPAPSGAAGGAGGVPTTASPGDGSGGGPGAGAGGGAPGGARALPGATGLLAQIDGATLQVQSAETQTAVTYSATTTFSNTVAARLSDLVVGVCVQARSARPVTGTGGADPTSSPTAAPQASSGPIAAASVEISPAVDGKCSVLGGTRTPRPGGTPTGGQTRAPGAGGNGFSANGIAGFGAFGKVTAVNGASFTVESSLARTEAASDTTQTVTTSATTTYTRTREADAKALAVGLCVTALGTASDTGSIAAASIMLRPAENGSCSSGFGRGGPGGPGGSPTAAGGGSGA